MGGKKSNHLKQALHRFSGVRNWQLFLILVPLLFVAATLLRFDHLRMLELRTAVLEADANEDDEAIKTSLMALQQFVFSHIVVNIVEQNGTQKITFGTGPFYLEHQYLRAANAAIEAAEEKLKNSGTPESDAYAVAMARCRPQALAHGWSLLSTQYYECLNRELEAYPTVDRLAETELKADVPSTELFRYNYASPIWAPTWAGWVILLCVFLILVIIIRILIWCVLRIALFFLDKH